MCIYLTDKQARQFINHIKYQIHVQYMHMCTYLTDKQARQFVNHIKYQIHVQYMCIYLTDKQARQGLPSTGFQHLLRSHDVNTGGENIIILKYNTCTLR